MLMRLTRAKRLKAGWLFALVYMLCVLAPGISFAFSDGLRAAACLTDENHGLGVVHELSEASAQHAHKGDYVHEHSTGHAHDSHKDIAYAADEAPAPANGPHKTSGAQCCGAVCLSALPATIVDIVKPSAPT